MEAPNQSGEQQLPPVQSHKQQQLKGCGNHGRRQHNHTHGHQRGSDHHIDEQEGYVQQEAVEERPLKLLGHESGHNHPQGQVQRDLIKFRVAVRHVGLGQVAIHPYGVKLGIGHHKLFQWDGRPVQKLLPADLLVGIRFPRLRLDALQHRVHGQQGEENGDAHQHRVGRGLVGAHGGAQKGQGDDIPGKRGSHHQQGGEQGDHRGEKENFQRLHAVAIDIDQAVCRHPILTSVSFA